MRVAILCGGLGTRMREHTEFRPKPLVEVGGKPVLWHIMKSFAHHGLKEFVLCLGYRGDMIKDYFLNYTALSQDFTLELGKPGRIDFHGQHDESDFRVTLAETGGETQTGGRLARIRRYLDGGTFMATYGDGVADVDIGKLLAFHRAHGKLATLTTVRPHSRFGILDLGPAGEVQRFREKPQGEGWANAGFFVFEPPVLDYLGGDGCVLEREPLERLAREGQLMAFRHEGFFFAMDTFREWKALNDLWAAGNAPWKVWR